MSAAMRGYTSSSYRPLKNPQDAGAVAGGCALFMLTIGAAFALIAAACYLAVYAVGLFGAHFGMSADTTHTAQFIVVLVMLFGGGVNVRTARGN